MLPLSYKASHRNSLRRDALTNQLKSISKEEIQEFQTRHRNPQLSFLPGSKNVLIRDSTITQVGQVRTQIVNNLVNNGPGNPDYGLHLLSKTISHGALHDSSERYPPPRCNSKESQHVITAISDWANDLTASANVLWVSSPLGADKTITTAIAQTIAETLSQEGRLAGSFFFERGSPRRDHGHSLFSTLAYQIATNFPGMRGHINSAMNFDPTFPTKSSSVQLQALIVQPFRKLMFSSVVAPLVSTIIIDALDECDTPETQQDIMKLILTEIAKKPSIPLRFLLLSRPDDHIRELLDEYASSQLVWRIELDMDISLHTANLEPGDPNNLPTAFEQYIDPSDTLICRSTPSSLIDVLSILHAHSLRKRSPADSFAASARPKSYRAPFRVEGFNPIDAIMSTMSKPSESLTSIMNMDISGTSLLTPPTMSVDVAPRVSSLASVMSVDAASRISSLKSAMSVDSMPRGSLVAWTTRMKISQSSFPTTDALSLLRSTIPVHTESLSASTSRPLSQPVAIRQPLPPPQPFGRLSGSTPKGGYFSSPGQMSYCGVCELVHENNYCPRS